MSYNKEALTKKARELGVIRDTFEKVLRLTDILTLFENNSIIKEQFALKGGTAINLMVLNLPRLSTDIDLDFTKGAISKENLQEQKQILRNEIEQSLNNNSYTLELSKSKTTVALDSLVFGYINAAGNKDCLKIDINYSLRCHILPEQKEFSKPDFLPSVRTTIVNPIEIYAAKTVALLSRAAPRDLFDINYFINNISLTQQEKELYRKATIFYMATSCDKTPLRPKLDKINEITQNMVFRNLLQVLREKDSFELEVAKETAKNFLKENIQPTEDELLFLRKFSKGEYKPQLLFEDEEIFGRIKNHPMAKWKAMKNKTYKNPLD